MKRFAIFSVDDNDQLCVDIVKAQNRSQAKREIKILRPYAHILDSYTAKDLEKLAQQVREAE